METSFNIVNILIFKNLLLISRWHLNDNYAVYQFNTEVGVSAECIPQLFKSWGNYQTWCNKVLQNVFEWHML